MKNLILFIYILTFSISNSKSQVLDYFICEDSLYNPGGAVYVRELKAFNNCLYVVGDGLKFGGTTELNRAIGFWDNNQWFSMDNSVNISPGGKCVVEYNGKIFMGGGFTNIGSDLNAKYCAVWNGTNWLGLVNSYGNITHYVYAMTVYNDMLIIGGVFNGIGDDPFNFIKIAAYDGTDFVNIGSMPSEVNALAVFNGELFAGGWWATLKKYIGGTGFDAWEDVGGYMNYYIQDMEVDTVNNFLYVCGGFGIVDNSINTDGVAIWDGFSWSSIGHGNDEYSGSYAVHLYHGDVYLGGGYDTINGKYVSYCHWWDGEDWQKVGTGIYAEVNDLEVFRDTLFIGQAWYLNPNDTVRGVLARYYSPYDGNCRYLQPRVQSLTDTFYMYSGEAEVQLYNNNAYVDSWEWDFGDLGTDNVKDPLHIYTAIGDYNVQVTVTDGTCVKTANKTIHVVLGDNIKEFENIDFKIFPNPSQNNFTVQTNLSASSKAELRITGINGHTKTTIPVSAEKTEINTNGWSKGTYVCNLFVDGKLVKSEKMILN